jgi:hypothetical protein
MRRFASSPGFFPDLRDGPGSEAAFLSLNQFGTDGTDLGLGQIIWLACEWFEFLDHWHWTSQI